MNVSDGTIGEAGARDDRRLKRHIGIVGLLFTAVGSIIGSGWLFGALTAAQLAGPASILAWALGAVMILFIGLVYAELGTLFPVSGGVVRFPHYAFGSLASFTTGWITWIAAASTAPIEVLAAMQYATNYVPWLQTLADGVPVLTLPGYAVATALMALFSLVNVIGIRWFARVNNLLVGWKLAVIVLVVTVFAATAFHGANFRLAAAGGFMPSGWQGVFSSIAGAGIIFSYLGFRQGVELAGETSNPRRNVPIAIIGALVITATIYIALQVAFIGALPGVALRDGWAHVGTGFSGGAADIAATFGPLAALAGLLGLSWLATLLYLDAVISPADTGFIYTTITARISYAMGRNGNAPKVLASVNRRGVPWVSVILTFVVGLVFFLPFPGWQKLVGFVTSATVLSFGSGPLTLLALRRELPDRERVFRLPWANVLAYLAFLSSNLIVYWAGWDTEWKLSIAVLLGFLVLAIHELTGRGTTPPLEWRSGFWVIPWLGGLALISYLGAYPEPGAGAGNLGWLPFGWSFIVVALFSAAIMWLAVSRRLPRARVERHLHGA